MNFKYIKLKFFVNKFWQAQWDCHASHIFTINQLLPSTQCSREAARGAWGCNYLNPSQLFGEWFIDKGSPTSPKGNGNSRTLFKHSLSIRQHQNGRLFILWCLLIALYHVGILMLYSKVKKNIFILFKPNISKNILNIRS